MVEENEETSEGGTIEKNEEMTGETAEEREIEAIEIIIAATMAAIDLPAVTTLAPKLMMMDGRELNLGEGGTDINFLFIFNE